MIPIADEPCYQKYICPKCKEEQYIYHSRIDPKTYSKDSVITKGNTIKIKDNN